MAPDRDMTHGDLNVPPQQKPAYALELGWAPRRPCHPHFGGYEGVAEGTPIPIFSARLSISRGL